MDRIHYVGVGIVKFQQHDKTSQEIAEILGMSEADFLQIADFETFLPPLTMVYDNVRPSGFNSESQRLIERGEVENQNTSTVKGSADPGENKLLPLETLKEYWDEPALREHVRQYVMHHPELGVVIEDEQLRFIGDD